MPCTNCNNTITESDNFCSSCGAKIMRERITFKNLIASSFLKAIGWDNKYFLTMKTLIVNPELVIRGYLEGLRKRYVKPIVFFAIGMSISLILFNVFQDEFIEISTGGDVSAQLLEQEANESFLNVAADESSSPEAIERQNLILIAKVQKILLKYFNIYAFSLLPLYTFTAFLVFRKRYNYTEHLIINSYLQGVIFVITILFFLASMLISPKLHMYGTIPSILYYSYAYGRLFEQTFWQAVWHLLKFIGIGILMAIFLGLISVLIGFMVAAFS